MIGEHPGAQSVHVQEYGHLEETNFLRRTAWKISGSLVEFTVSAF